MGVKDASTSIYHNQSTDYFDKDCVTSTYYKPTSDLPEKYEDPHLSKHYFYAMHISAVVSLVVSIIGSLTTLIIVHRSAGGKQSFWKRKLNERLVVYLATVDLCTSTDHLVDHVYVISHLTAPPHTMCAVLGTLLGCLTSIQAMLVFFIAIMAYLLIARENPVSFGRYDWRLLLGTCSVPVVSHVIFLSLGFMGPARGWCLADMNKSSGVMVNVFYAGTMLLVIVSDIFFYSAVWRKISSTAKQLEGFENSDENIKKSRKSRLRTARLTMQFVLAYIIQWIPYMIYAGWSFFAESHPALLVISTILCNLGGLFNLLVYTIARRRKRRPNPPVKGEVGKIHSIQNNISSSSCASTSDMSGVTFM